MTRLEGDWAGRCGCRCCSAWLLAAGLVGAWLLGRARGDMPPRVRRTPRV